MSLEFESEDLQKNESFKDFENIDALGQAFLDHGSKITDLEGRIPNIPENADDYEVALESGEDSFIHKEEIPYFQALAKEWGLRKSQFGKMMNWLDEFRKQNLEKANKSSKDARDKAEETLKKDLGESYQPSIEKIKAIVKFAASKEDQEWLNNTGLGSDPRFVRILHKLAPFVSEDQLITSQESGGEKEMKRSVTGQPQLDFSKSMGKKSE